VPLWRTSVPPGNRVEAFHGGRIANESFRPTRHNLGLRTGTQGVGHAVLMVPDIDAALNPLLGFRITDLVGPPHYCSGIAQPHAS
jgi:hypothetical protein